MVNGTFIGGYKIQNKRQLDSIGISKGTCNVPGFWTEEVSEGTYFEQYGITTLHLRLALPDTIQTYALKLNSVYTAYELWVNGELLTKVGTVGETESASTPNFHTRLVQLPHHRNVNLFLCIASWEHRRGGGVNNPIVIGTNTQVHQNWLKNQNYQLFYFAFTFGLSTYLIFLFLFYPENKSYLYFALFAFLSSVRSICIDEIVIDDMLGDIPYYWNQRLRYFGFFAAMASIILYIESLFKKHTHALLRVGAFMLYGFSASLFIMPFNWASYLSPLFQLVACLGIIGIYHLYFKVKAYKQVENLVLILGGVIVAITSIHHMLVANNLIESEYYHNLGIGLYIFSQVLSLAYTHRKVYYKANQLSKDLLSLIRVWNIRWSCELLRFESNPKN